MTEITAFDDGENAQEVAPRDQRANVMLIATIEHFGGQSTTTHRVRDLSPGGIRVDGAADLRAGATVLISVGALQTVSASVRWVREGAAGLAFAEQINPDEARAKVAMAPAETGRRQIAPAAPGLKAGWIKNLSNPYRK